MEFPGDPAAPQPITHKQQSVKEAPTHTPLMDTEHGTQGVETHGQGPRTASRALSSCREQWRSCRRRLIEGRGEDKAQATGAPELGAGAGLRGAKVQTLRAETGEQVP